MLFLLLLRLLNVLSTSRTVCDLYFIVHFIFHIANCLLCIYIVCFYCILGLLLIF